MARILIANDNPDLLEVCQQVLETAGHDVRTVTGGQHALREAREHPPDAIVVDLKMPDMDGISAIRALRIAPETAAIPILMMSGTPGARESAREAGADAFLAKPFTAEALSAEVDGVLARSELRPPGA